MELHLFLAVFVFFFGLAVGSFLNCLIYRVGVSEIPSGRSYCPKCKKQLSYRDLVPVLSYLFLLGKCRYCREKISIEYPLVELLTGALFLFTFLSLGVSIELFYVLVVLFFLIFVFVYDLKHYLIPDFANFSLAGISFGYLLLNSFFLRDFSIFKEGLLSALGVFLFFFSLYYFTKGRGMGFGDVKFVVFMGLFLGFPNIVVGLFISFFLGAIIGLALIAFKKKGIKSQVPFAPFLIIGTLTAYFYGEKIVDFYLTYALY